MGLHRGKPGDDTSDHFVKYDENTVDSNPFINGTEGNGGTSPDTEDLDGNGSLNNLESYFEYTLVLSDTTTSMYQSQYNGWRLYRIPVASEFSHIYTNGSSEPKLNKISYSRIWFEVEDSTKIDIAYLDVIGNKWEKNAIRATNLPNYPMVTADVLNTNNEYLSIETIDNQKNQHYTPPADTYEKTKEDEPALEQALKIVYGNIQPNHIATTRQINRDNADFLAYSKIRFWVYPEKQEYSSNASDSVYVVFRLGADSTNYYEIKYPVAVNEYQAVMDQSKWKELEFSFDDLTFLKSISSADTIVYKKDGIIYRKVRLPILSNIKMLMLGIQVPANQEAFSGNVYFDDVRAADPNSSSGLAAYSSITTKFADFSTLDLSMEWKTADFQSGINRSQSNTVGRENKTTLNVSNNYNIQKFFPINWGLSLPLALKYVRSLGIPKYQANSDNLRENLKPEEKNREKNQSYSKEATFSYALGKTPDNKILEYTLKNITSSTFVRQTCTKTSTNIDSTISYGINGSYKMDVPREKVGINLFRSYSFFYLPKSYDHSATFRADNPHRWRWEVKGDSVRHWIAVEQTVPTRSLDLNNTIKYDLLTDVATTFTLTSKRDLRQKFYSANVNVGTETEHGQTLNITYSPEYFTDVLTYNVTATSNYRDTKRATSSSTTTTTTGKTYVITGNSTRTIKVSSTLKNSNLLATLANKIDPTRKISANDRQSSTANLDDKSGDISTDTQQDKSDADVSNPKDDKNPPSEEPDIDEKAEKRESLDEMLKSGSITEDEYRKLTQALDNKEDKANATTDTTKVNKDKKENGKSINPLASAVIFFSKFQNIAASYSNTYGSDFENRDTRPFFLYQIGAPNAIERRDIRQRSDDNLYSLGSGYPIFKNLTSDFKYSYAIARRYASSSNQTVTVIFPDVHLTLTQFEKLIGAEKILTSSRITSGYTVNTKQSGDINWTKPKTEVNTYGFSPLVGWTGNWKNDVTSTFSFNVNRTENITHMSGYDNLTQTDTKTITGAVSYTFTAENGFKLPFMKKRIAFKNEMKADLNVSYETSNGSTSGQTNKTIDKDTSKLTITPAATYNFSRNVKGGLSSTYEISNDKRRNDELTTFKLEIWTEIQF